MPIPKRLLNKAEQMARQGRPITQIQEKLNVENYDELWDYLNSVEAYSWRGAKTIITRRLRSLVFATRRERRQELAEEARHMVDYLYYQGVEQSRILAKVKKAL